MSELFSLKELFPSEFPGHRLSADNHFYQWPLTDFGGAAGYRAKEGAIIRGWSGSPPYEGSSPTVLVVERLEPYWNSDRSRVLEEPGIYWYHWDADRKDFARPVVEPQSIDPRKVKPPTRRKRRKAAKRAARKKS